MPEKQFVVFKVGAEEYAVPIFEVREIVRCGEVKELPNAPAYLEGVINLRGNVVPVVNLAKRFKLTTTSEEAERKVIVSEIDASRVGVIVDDVTEVLRLPENQIEPPPAIKMDRDCVKGIGKAGDRLLVLLSFRNILSDEELHELQEMN